MNLEVYKRLPQIPEDILKLILGRVARQGDEFAKEFNATNYEYYSLMGFPLVVDWIDKYILSQLYSPESWKSTVTIGAHLIKPKVAIHKDHTRDECLNYILKTGGDQVMTRFYEEDQLTITEEYHLRSWTWHALKTNVYHGIHGIQSDSHRIAITIDVPPGSVVGLNSHLV